MYADGMQILRKIRAFPLDVIELCCYAVYLCLFLSSFIEFKHLNNPTVNYRNKQNDIHIYPIIDWKCDKDKMISFFEHLDKQNYDIIVFDELSVFWNKYFLPSGLSQEGIQTIIWNFCVKQTGKGSLFIFVMQFENDFGDTYIAKDIMQLVDYKIKMLDYLFFPIIENFNKKEEI